MYYFPRVKDKKPPLRVSELESKMVSPEDSSLAEKVRDRTSDSEDEFWKEVNHWLVFCHLDTSQGHLERETLV